MTSSSEVKRAVRVAERVRAELMDLVLRGAVRDPAARGATVSRVVLTDDLQHARVYLRLLDADPPEAQRKGLVAAMSRASRFLRRELGKRLELKRTPSLEFFWDEGMDHALRIETLLEEVKADLRKPEETP